MFTVLNIEKRKNTLCEKIFGGFRKDVYQVRTVAVYKGAPFYILDVKIGKKGINTEKIIVSVGKCAKRMVTNDGALLPKVEEIGFFKSDELYKNLLQNTFLNILEQNITQKNPITVCFIDRGASCVDFAKRLSVFSSTLNIVTDKKEKYLHIMEEITEETGLCPVLKKTPENAEITINIDEGYMVADSGNLKMTVEDRGEFTVPEIYNYLKPKSIDKYEFYSALYELCGVFSLGGCIFETVCVNYEKKHVDTVTFS